jgi:hypothetical protein
VRAGGRCGARRVATDRESRIAVGWVLHHTGQVSFIAPPLSPTPPGLATGISYEPILLVGKNKQRVGNTSGKKLKY